MAIKQSTLEKKWYYRAVRVFFLLLPWVAAIIIFFKAGLISVEIFQKDFPLILQQNINTIIQVIVGLIAYFVILNLSWRIFIYIVFGGLENDTIKKNIAVGISTGKAGQSSVPAGLSSISEEDKKQIGFYISILIILGIIYYVSFIWKPVGMPTNGNTGTKGGKCVSTGCGLQWYCSGTYYDEEGVEKRINGCLPQKAGDVYSSWSGTCRQCP